MRKIIFFVVIGLVSGLVLVSCGGTEKKKEKAIQSIETALAGNNFSKARKCLADIPSEFNETKQEYTDKINISEINMLIASGKDQEAKELFVMSCTTDRFLVDNVATALSLCDDNFIENKISGYKLNETFSKECRNCAPDDIEEKKNNNAYNEEVKVYNGLIDAVLYAALNDNNLTLAQKCLTYYMPIAKESSRTENSSYSSNHYDLTFTEDYYSRDEAAKTMESLVKVKGIENQFNSTISSKGKSAVNEDGMAVLNELVKYMKVNQNLRVKVTAHTNKKSRKNKNLELSKEQADAVVRYLISKGVPAQRLQSEGLGEEGFQNNTFSKVLGDTYVEFIVIAQ